MDPSPVLSIIIPCYNYGHFVGQAIETALSQTFTDIEVIVINDASTDNTGAVLDGFRDNPRVRVIHHETNQGHIATYNEGIGLARGAFITLLSADDYFLSPDALRLQMDLMAEDHVGISYSAFTLVGDEGVMGEFHPRSESGIYSGLDEFRRLMWHNNMLHSGAIMRRELQERLGPYDARMYHQADWDMWLRAFASGFDVGYIARPLYAYRIHGTAMHYNTWPPREAADEALLVLDGAFAALPAEGADDIRRQRKAVERRALLVSPTADVYSGRRTRAWQGLGYAVRRSPGIVFTRMWWRLACSAALITVAGGSSYRRLRAGYRRLAAASS